MGSASSANARILKDSHFLPAALFRLVRDKSATGREANPVIISKERAEHSQLQMHTYLLCAVCEDRFNKNGESWVLSQCFRYGEGFKLRDSILRASPLRKFPSREYVYSAQNIADCDISQLAYFASSVLWRGSIERWWHGKRELVLPKLGKRYDEQFRQYLLGTMSFPMMFLW